MRESPLAAFIMIAMRFFATTSIATACYIHGANIGYCEPALYTDGDFREANMPFCSPFVKYSTCVPKYNPLPPSREFQDGRWFNNTMTIKDKWVEEYFHTVVNSRLEVEGNKTLHKQGVDEYGNRGSPVPRFTDNFDCQKAFKAYMCYINFPRCDGHGNSLVTCRSACENMMVACQNQRDLWRCGDSQFFNGYEAEEPDFDENEDPIYLRDFFPGQPFRDVEWGSGRQPNIICTPSIRGAAPLSLHPWGTGIVGIIPVVIAIASFLLAPYNGRDLVIFH